MRNSGKLARLQPCRLISFGLVTTDPAELHLLKGSIKQACLPDEAEELVKVVGGEGDFDTRGIGGEEHTEVMVNMVVSTVGGGGGIIKRSCCFGLIAIFQVIGCKGRVVGCFGQPGTDSVPWHYAQFLDYAAEHILLRKVGGGYIFVHRLLLEYFASLDN